MLDLEVIHSDRRDADQSRVTRAFSHIRQQTVNRLARSGSLDRLARVVLLEVLRRLLLPSEAQRGRLRQAPPLPSRSVTFEYYGRRTFCACRPRWRATCALCGNFTRGNVALRPSSQSRARRALASLMPSHPSHRLAPVPPPARPVAQGRDGRRSLGGFGLADQALHQLDEIVVE
jgi:hypothetical protein